MTDTIQTAPGAVHRREPQRRVGVRKGDPPIIGSAICDGPYRYVLARRWGSEPLAAFVMLNPSSADAERDDPTIRRCTGFALREGCGGIVVLNLYALRASRPVELVGHLDPEGPRNATLWSEALDGDRVAVVVAAWGSFTRTGLEPSRALAARDTSGWQCLGTTADGSPRHPLYLRKDVPLRRWVGRPFRRDR